MARLVRSLGAVQADGQRYDVRIYGRPMANGWWEGWIEFAPADGAPALRTPRETTRPTLDELDYWATGLTPVYVEGTLSRTLGAVTEVADVATEPPGTETCASNELIDVPGAVIDPIALYARGEETLREKLGVLSVRHLRGIARGYRFVPAEVELESLNEPQLTEVIVAGVRACCAA